jgi:selenocysteine-specific elongation factor
LWIDRAFSIKGSGTVVTGTLTGGAIEQGDNLVVEPGSIAVKVRRLQSHGDEVTRIEPGRRAALNLSGIQPGDAGRGQAVVTEGAWHFTDRIDCSLTVLASLSHPVQARGAYALHLGTGEWPVRTRVIGDAEIEPGATGSVRLYLPTRLPLTPGDRYVLRESGRGETVGGGEVLDVDPVLPTSRAQPSRTVERVVAERGWIDTQELARLTGCPAVGTVGPWVVDPTVLQHAIAALSQKIDGALPLGVDIAALDTKERALLDAGTIERAVVRTGRVVREDTEDVLARHPWLSALADKPFDAPPPTGITPAEVRLLVRRNMVIEREGVHFLPSTLATALAAAAALLTDDPAGFTVAQLRVVLDSTRRVIMPLLAELDARGLTRRNGDVRLLTALGRDALSVESPPLG